MCPMSEVVSTLHSTQSATAIVSWPPGSWPAPRSSGGGGPRAGRNDNDTNDINNDNDNNIDINNNNDTSDLNDMLDDVNKFDVDTTFNNNHNNTHRTNNSIIFQ